MPTENKHTPLPWKRSNFGEILGPDDQDFDDTVIGILGESSCLRSHPHSIVKHKDDQVHNAEFIVKACNEYYPNQSTIASQKEVIGELVEALEQCAEYFNNRADCDQPSGSYPIPNDEMKLLVEIEPLIDKAKGQS